MVSCSTTEVRSFRRLAGALRRQPHLPVRGAHSSPIPCLSLRHGLYPYRSSGLPSAKEHPQGFFNTELFKLCPFIPEPKLWVFWAPIFIIETVYGASVFLIFLGLIVAYRKARRLL